MPSTLAVDKIKATTGDTFTLPTADGSAGQIIKTDGSGVLSFTSDIDTGLLNMVEDTTPELGGDLDVNGKVIVSASNGDIAVTPNGNGNVIIDGLKHPQADGSSGQYLKTDGSGQLSFGTVNTDLSNDSSPQLSAALDCQNYNVSNCGTLDGSNLQIDFGSI